MSENHSCGVITVSGTASVWPNTWCRTSPNAARPASAVASVIGAPPTSRHSSAPRSRPDREGSAVSICTIDGGANMCVTR